MKKVINGSVYNTETAKFICKEETSENNHIYGSPLKRTKYLYKTKSNKYFFYLFDVFKTWVVTNNDDIDPEYEYTEVEHKVITPISYEAAVKFASERMVEDESSKADIIKYFPELDIEKISDDNQKIQKKIYLSPKAEWYLDMLVNGSEETNSSLIERLIKAEYKRLYDLGVVNNDPFFEL